MKIASLTPWQWIAALASAVLLGGLTGLFSLWTLLAVVALVSLYLFVRYPMVLLAACFACVVLGQFGRVPPGSASGTVLLLDGLAGLLCLVWFVMAIWKRWPFVISPAHLAWIAFLIVAGVLLLRNPFGLRLRDLAQDGFYLVRLIFYSSLAWSIPQLFGTQAKAERIYRWTVIAGLSITVLGFAQLFLFPDIGPLSKYGWDPHVGRLVSSFLDPNYLGGYFAIFLSLVLGRFVQEKGRFPIISVALVLIATVLTYSRSGYLAVAIVALLYGLRYSWKLVVVGVVCIVPLALSIPRVQQRVVGGFSIDKTSQDRIDSWSNALAISDKYSVLGIGYNNYQPAQESLGLIRAGSTSRSSGGSDSSLLNVVATTGYFGTALFLITVLAILKHCLDLVRAGKRNVQSSVALSLLVMAPALFVHSFFVNATFYPFILMTLSVLVGLTYVRQDS